MESYTKEGRVQSELEGEGYKGFRISRSYEPSHCEECGIWPYRPVTVQAEGVYRVACDTECARKALNKAKRPVL